MSGTWDIGGPGEGSGSDPNRWTNTKHLDHFVLFIGIKAEERTGRPGKDGKTETYAVAHCDYVVCFQDQRCWTDVDVGGKALAPALTSASSPIVAGVLIEGEKGIYDNAPVLLADATPEDIEATRAILDEYAHKMPSGRILFDDTAYNKAAGPF